ncbi:hypothetical protein INE81_00791 [Bacteroides salyersiae]|nr:hypothetical protein INE81_00791 [Bacteroides salyersiae]
MLSLFLLLNCHCTHFVLNYIMKIEHVLLVLSLCMCCVFPVTGNAQEVTNSSFGNAYILPVEVKGVQQPVLSLNGNWQFKYSLKSNWTTIRVPGEVAMQGYAIEHDKPFVYRKSFTVPVDYAGKPCYITI